MCPYVIDLVISVIRLLHFLIANALAIVRSAKRYHGKLSCWIFSTSE